MLKLMNVMQLRQNLKNSDSQSRFSGHLIYCFECSRRPDFKFSAVSYAKVPGCVAGFWAMLKHGMAEYTPKH